MSQFKKKLTSINKNSKSKEQNKKLRIFGSIPMSMFLNILKSYLKVIGNKIRNNDK